MRSDHEHETAEAALNISMEDVFAATKIIEDLEPKPGRPFTNTQNYVIVPDVFVVKNEGEWVVLLNDDGLPRMRISPYYKQAHDFRPGWDGGNQSVYGRKIAGRPVGHTEHRAEE